MQCCIGEQNKGVMGKVKGERLEVRGGNKTERHLYAARFGIDMWYCYISSRLTDLCAHSIIGFAIAEDKELTVAEEFSGIGIRR